MRKIFTRPVIIIAALLLQLSWLFVHAFYLSSHYAVISFLVYLISVIAMLWIINREDSAEFKLPWVILILTAPIIGGIIYFLTSSEGVFKKQHRRYCAAEAKMNAGDAMIPKAVDTAYTGQMHCIASRGFPVYQHTQSKFYSLADQAFPDMLDAFRSAKRYIYLEYFILTPGQMWDTILSILTRKAQQGVDVRVIYDDVATMSHLPADYPKVLEKQGIHCTAFNPLIPVCSVAMNHRDHRKIAVVDGEVAFTGGFNLADEYINLVHPYGERWKDTGVRLQGDAAEQFARMFLTMWHTVHPEEEELPINLSSQNVSLPSDGYVQPYAHAPLRDKQILSRIYETMISRADRSVYIYTPYLIPDAALTHSLCLAAERGVDVRIVLPGVPDKKLIYRLTLSHAAVLQRHGVKLYTYTPGFVHAKCMVCDGVIASIGTGNMDCRSLYHSFENGCMLYGSHAVEELQSDFLSTLQSCQELQLPQGVHSGLSGVWNAALRMVAPLL